MRQMILLATALTRLQSDVVGAVGLLLARPDVYTFYRDFLAQHSILTNNSNRHNYIHKFSFASVVFILFELIDWTPYFG